MSIFKVQKIRGDSNIPVKKHKDDSGFDVFFDNVKSVYIHGGGNGEVKLEENSISRRFSDGVLRLSYLERALIGTGVKVAVDPGYEIQVRPRSGLALKQGLTVLNTPGTIDAGYRDEVGIIICNNSRQDQLINLGDRIAQLVIMKVELPEIEIVDELPPADRGEKGFGSTGSK